MFIIIEVSRMFVRFELKMKLVGRMISIQVVVCFFFFQTRKPITCFLSTIMASFKSKQHTFNWTKVSIVLQHYFAYLKWIGFVLFRFVSSCPILKFACALYLFICIMRLQKDGNNVLKLNWSIKFTIVTSSVIILFVCLWILFCRAWMIKPASATSFSSIIKYFVVLKLQEIC